MCRGKNDIPIRLNPPEEFGALEYQAVRENSFRLPKSLPESCPFVPDGLLPQPDRPAWPPRPQKSDVQCSDSGYRLASPLEKTPTGCSSLAVKSDRFCGRGNEHNLRSTRENPGPSS